MEKPNISKLIEEIKPKITKYLELVKECNNFAEQFFSSQEYINNSYWKNKNKDFWRLNKNYEEGFDDLAAKFKKSFKKLLNSEFVKWLQKKEDFRIAKRRMSTARKGKEQKGYKDLVILVSNQNCVASPKEYRKLLLLEIICANVFGFVIFNQSQILNGRSITKLKLEKMQKYAKKLATHLKSSLIFPLPLKQVHLVKLLDELSNMHYQDINIKNVKRNHALILRQVMMQELTTDLIREAFHRLYNTAIADIAISICAIIFPDGGMDRAEAIKMVKKINNKQRSDTAYNPMYYLADLTADFRSLGF